MMPQEDEKLKKKLSKRGIIIGLTAVVLAGAGITGFLFANQRDAKAMESGIEKVAVEGSMSEAVKSVKTTKTTDNKEFWLDKHKIIVTSQIPDQVNVSATDAAKYGLDEIAKDTKQVDDQCEVELYHMNTYGTGKSTGAWIGTVILNGVNRYEFHVNDETGEIIKRTDYVADANPNSWTRVNSTEKLNEETIIDDHDLAAFNKIDASDINYADCEIVEGKNYSIYIKYNNKQQTASYESKNGVLTVAMKAIPNNIKDNQIETRITITVPKDTKFASIVTKSKVGGISISKFAVDELDLNQSCGSIDMQGTTYTSAKLSADCGDISLTGCTMNNSKIDADCGSVMIKDCNMKDSTITADCGDVDCSNVVSNNISIKASCGSIEAVGDFTGKCQAEARMGDVTIGCTKEKSKYSYDLSVRLGTIYVDDQAVKGNSYKTPDNTAKNSIIASAHTGNCSISFKADPKAKVITHEESEDEEDYDTWEDDDWDFD